MAENRMLVSIPNTCAELGGVSRTTVYDLVNRGLLTKVNIGSRSFVTGDSLALYVESLAQPVNSD